MSDPRDQDFDDTLTDDELALLADVDALLADEALWGGPSAGVEDAVAASIAAERAPAVAPVDELAARRAKRSRVWSLVGAAVAGAAAAGLIVGIVAKRDDSGSTASEARPGAAQQLTLTGTDLAPGVSGSAALTAHPSGVEIHLAVPGLPERTGGEFYQVWVKTCDGSLLVPAGSFHDLTDATGWVGVSMEQFPVVTVTREIAVGGKDPAQGSSGEIVASGTVGSCPS